MTKLRNIFASALSFAAIVVFDTVLVIILLVLGAAAFGGEPVAWVSCGGSGKFDESVGYNRAFKNGCIQWAMENGPKIEAAGFTRVCYHNPGGLYLLADESTGDKRMMHVNQWPLAKQAAASYAVDSELAAMHAILRRQHGVSEQIYYVGSPAPLSTNQVFDAVRPFLLEGSSLAFDHTSQKKHVAPLLALIKKLRRTGWLGKIYIEAFPQSDVEPKDYRGKVHGVMAQHRFVYGDFKRIALLDRAPEFGEVLMTSDGKPTYAEQSAQWPEFVTRMRRDW